MPQCSEWGGVIRRVSKVSDTPPNSRLFHCLSHRESPLDSRVTWCDQLSLRLIDCQRPNARVSRCFVNKGTHRPRASNRSKLSEWHYTPWAPWPVHQVLVFFFQKSKDGRSSTAPLTARKAPRRRRGRSTFDNVLTFKSDIVTLFFCLNRTRHFLNRQFSLRQVVDSRRGGKSKRKFK